MTSFEPAWWLPGPHAQTLWGALCRGAAKLALRRERLEIRDGDFIDLDWHDQGAGPIVVILHGLEGSGQSRYARGLLAALGARGWRAVVMHFRGCSGLNNRLARSYHSGDTEDFSYLITTLRRRYRGARLAAVGFSLGGNVLLKFLGEAQDRAPLVAAVAVSVPFKLDNAAERLERGFSRTYQWWLLRSLRAKTRKKFTRLPSPIDLSRLDKLRSFWSFDHEVTAPLHGFTGVDDYYARSSSRQYLPGITVPTLIVHARDDPFMTPAAIPDANELSSSTRLELTARGGHNGFVAGAFPGRPYYWLDRRIPEFLAPYLTGSSCGRTTATP
ncbi:MAG: 2-succinyl-6-hydroxy-2,4-cyclohexadiene-1-carboxylate synthase [Chromatiales bacterium USCg_Taylor]|nr:MAG: 2-succinyl-6-hydroxy-2,4-cyclohexadiene-1-carboxylate synthase [Chromatiales bacterium USCg_Taylor]